MKSLLLKRLMVKNIDLKIEQGEFVVIVGLSGAGKSTLIRLIAGELQPTSGSIEYGSTVKIAHFTQHLPEMDERQRMIEWIQETSNDFEAQKGVRMSASQMLERFLFPSSSHGTVIGKLSGGERKRLYLLKLLMEQPNLLLLDEPTNDLDIQTLSVLESFLEEFPGVVITISHDRFFLDRIARKIWSIEQGEIEEYLGLYTDFMKEQKKQPEPKFEKREPEQKAAPKQEKKKMTFKEQKEYETILDDISSLEQQIEDIETEIEKAGADYDKLRTLTEQSESLAKAYEEKVDRWSYLQEIAES